MSEQVELTLIAAGWAGAVGALGLGIGWWVRRLSFAWLLTVVAVVAVGAVVAGVLGTARAMFLSAHDFTVVLQVSLVAGLVAVAFALGVAAVVSRWSRELRTEARRFGESGEYVDRAAGPVEFTGLSAELARTSERLRESRDRERQLERARRELVSWVSHDLRTPLAGMRAMAEALEDGMVDDPGRYHARMRAEVDHLVAMVDDLFELSRLQAGQDVRDPEPVVVGDLVSEALAHAEPLARAVGVPLAGSAEADLVVRGDPAALTRLLGNLTTNALRHTRPGGEVRLAATGTAGEVVLSVSDGCGGIPEADLPRVFDVAWRGSRARTPRGPDGAAGEGRGPLAAGAGLGLAIVQAVTHAHGGEVSVANRGAGCRFEVRLPRVAG